MKPTEDISDVESDQQVEGATWWPGQPQIIKDVLIGAAGVRPQHGYRLFNTYVPPAPLADLEGCEVPTLWIEHVETVYPEPTESSIFFDYAAHMVQRPEEKPNFGLVLVGAQGIGKDTMLLPLQYAVGTHNARVIEPDGLFDRFSRPGEQAMLCINEWRSAKDDHKQWSLYEACKHLLAAPPLMLPVENKFADVRYVRNVMRVFITTNDRHSIYLPPDDRRICVLESPLKPGWHLSAGRPRYFDELYGWLESGGNAAVRRWLLERDISQFKPHAAAPSTVAKQRMQAAWNRADGPLDDALERVGRPEVVFPSQLTDDAFDGVEALRALFTSGRLEREAARSGYFVARPESGRYFRMRTGSGGQRLQFRYALVKDEFRHEPPGRLEERILSALRVLAAAKTADGRPTLTEVR